MSNRGRIIQSVAVGSWGTATVYKTDGDEVPVLKPKDRELSKSRSLLNQYIGTSALSQQVISLTSLLDEAQDLEVESASDALTFFMSSLFCTILEDAIIQMQILQQCNNELKIQKTHADKTHLTALKYGVEMPVVTDDLSGIDVNSLGCTIYKIAKLDSDRNYVDDLLKKTYLELALRRRYQVLSDNLNIIIHRYEHRRQLEVDEAKNKMLRKDLMRQVRNQRNRFRTIIYDTDSIITGLQSQVEDSMLYTETAGRYVTNWEVARSEQHAQTIEDTEKGSITTISYYKQKYDQEVRVHSEVELLVNICINETLDKIDEWMNKYDNDLEKIDLKITLMKNDHQDMYNKRIKMEETIEKHDEEMKAWIKFKDDREKVRQYQEKMTNAAISVQAWWRGLLVRLQLGPYKPKKKPGDKKKK